jgi:hypothetical protein
MMRRPLTYKYGKHQVEFTIHAWLRVTFTYEGHVFECIFGGPAVMSCNDRILFYWGSVVSGPPLKASTVLSLGFDRLTPVGDLTQRGLLTDQSEHPPTSLGSQFRVNRVW